MLLLLASLLATSAPDHAHPSWMVGTWGWQNPGERGTDCGSDHDATYDRDGSYNFMDERGYWRIEGDRLIETMLSPGGTGDPALRGKPQVMRFVRVGKNALRILAPARGKLIKCPAG
ncbi:hypothetical protein E5A73_07035 [Sphingomonas gei]|uniref:Uncharacterized protein n=1 Tax=Sphingomonas gei TaxID=1395960 RepID=A0A4S1XGD7_9SPHN|nr:hypothetical protein [Sphingomonas gei]TGX55171.1 hypothetical protein E5A73_07035 [Sphingomonas gei]